MSGSTIPQIKEKWDLTQNQNPQNFTKLQKLIWLLNNTNGKRFTAAQCSNVYEQVFVQKFIKSAMSSHLRQMNKLNVGTSVEGPSVGRGNPPFIFTFYSTITDDQQKIILRAWNDYRNTVAQKYSKNKKIKSHKAAKQVKHKLNIARISKSLPTNISNLYNYCLVNGFTREMPRQEALICEIIINYLQFKLPFGGTGLMIGTPTMLCASTHPNYKCLLTDNLEVAFMLNRTTSTNPTMIIGNAINPKKAELKAQQWRSNNTTRHFDIKVERVDRDSYGINIGLMAEKNDLLKVILMSGGHWCGCKRIMEEHNLDANFRSPSKYLTEKYKNLHILAMTFINGNEFAVRYLHDGKDEIVK